MHFISQTKLERSQYRDSLRSSHSEFFDYYLEPHLASYFRFKNKMPDPVHEQNANEDRYDGWSLFSRALKPSRNKRRTTKTLNKITEIYMP
ncbi:hypothetical protein M408DRAFT_233520 [Serendipita vermifera MAFF 305830]|uniref:Uncharacterized protein n=1 Tax=Serendipita vermifera MAFF 305830 TaxID=933852 RepID=A0A0C2WD60_SERVB|nr:hypothetical protein M408DRAFT_233520 [Serendipita vermifera MAFF 305830]